MEKEKNKLLRRIFFSLVNLFFWWFSCWYSSDEPFSDSIWGELFLKRMKWTSRAKKLDNSKFTYFLELWLLIDYLIMELKGGRFKSKRIKMLVSPCLTMNLPVFEGFIRDQKYCSLQILIAYCQELLFDVIKHSEFDINLWQASQFFLKDSELRNFLFMRLRWKIQNCFTTLLRTSNNVHKW